MWLRCFSGSHRASTCLALVTAAAGSPFSILSDGEDDVRLDEHVFVTLSVGDGEQATAEFTSLLWLRG